MLSRSPDGENPYPNQMESLPLRIAGYMAESVVDGPGIRAVIFVQGCPHRCPGCHNPQTHSPDGGQQTTTAALLEKIRANPLLDGLTFSGGEPFLWAAELAMIGRAAKAMGLHIITYSGYTIERLLDMAADDPDVDALLTVTDILIDGPFIQNRRSLSLAFRGSDNQRLLDITAYPDRKAIKIITDDEIREMNLFCGF